MDRQYEALLSHERSDNQPPHPLASPFGRVASTDSLDSGMINSRSTSPDYIDNFSVIDSDYGSIDQHVVQKQIDDMVGNNGNSVRLEDIIVEETSVVETANVTTRALPNPDVRSKDRKEGTSTTQEDNNDGSIVDPDDDWINSLETSGRPQSIVEPPADFLGKVKLYVCKTTVAQ